MLQVKAKSKSRVNQHSIVAFHYFIETTIKVTSPVNQHPVVVFHSFIETTFEVGIVWSFACKIGGSVTVIDYAFNTIFGTKGSITRISYDIV